MTCPHCCAADALFDPKTARKQLRRYHRKGPVRTQALLLGAILEAGADRATLLDIGGGVGVLQHELVASGAARTTDVDASSGYLAAAQEEAARRGYGAKASYHHGDFVDAAPRIPAHDIVTLDRVICCYPDFDALVGASAARAQRLYGLVYPRGTRLARWGLAVANLWLRVTRSAFRTYAHPPARVDARVRAEGFRLRFHADTLLWRVDLYERAAQGAAP